VQPKPGGWARMNSVAESQSVARGLSGARPRARAFGSGQKGGSAPSPRSTRILLLLFLVSLPLVNPWVRGDGVGYYAYIRSMLVEHKLDFQNDWRHANLGFTLGKVHENGEVDAAQFTPTDHLGNHFSVGPSILWAPFLVPVHLAMLALHKIGANVRPDGYSRPYIVTMALTTALYGFLGLWLSFRLACRYVEERWALLATLAIWFASSLPVYMYFNPSWSHAQSVFMVAVFLWYWHATREARTLRQWIILGLISGLMLDVYYANIAVLVVPLFESLEQYWRSWRREGHDWQATRSLFIANIIYCFATVVAFLPTLVTRRIIYGRPLEFGYGGTDVWKWKSPHLGSVLFSSDHGLLAWTPILIPAAVGLFLLFKRERKLATYLIAAVLSFYYLIAIDPCWDGLSSFGNRKFISLVPLFVLGLAVSFGEFAGLLKKSKQALAIAASVTTILVIWNLGFIFQWGVHLIPSRGPISWRQMAYNQVVVVPERAATEVKAYFENRRGMMQRIELEDIEQQKNRQEDRTEK
jgi:Dolichyl-phosphate-mannose-protein mannosyltransferase